MAQNVNIDLAIDLYLSNHVSVGYCSKIAHCSEEEFIQELSKRNISIFQFESENELIQDISNALPKRYRTAGGFEGCIHMSDDFDEPLEEMKEYMN